MVMVVIIRYILPSIPLARFRKKLPVGITLAKKSAKIVETQTMMKAVATAKAISFREMSLRAQYCAARVSDSSSDRASTSSIWGWVNFLRNQLRDGMAKSTKKYNAISRLSATVRAEIHDSPAPKTLAIAAKLTPPPV